MDCCQQFWAVRELELSDWRAIRVSSYCELTSRLHRVPNTMYDQTGLGNHKIQRVGEVYRYYGG